MRLRWAMQSAFAGRCAIAMIAVKRCGTLALAAVAALSLITLPGASRAAATPAMPSSTHAPSTLITAAPPDAIDEIVVSGEQPGPGLWKVTKGDHVLWILGTLSPLPKRMTWRSGEVEKVVARAKEVIGQEQVIANVGFFRGITLLPSLLRARYNPDGAVLK